MLKYIEIQIKLKHQDIKPPSFLGSTLRGAFGVSLKKVTCINPSYECEGCFAKENCLYYDFYEKKNHVHKYRFDFELNQTNFNFGLYLFEDATKKLPYVLSSLQMMLTQKGLGVKREKFEIDSISCNGIKVYDGEKFDLSSVKEKKFAPKSITSSHSLILKTPLRMKYQGKLLTSKPSLKLLLSSIQNRLHELKNLPRTKLGYEPTCTEHGYDVRFLDQTRRSNRQKTKLQIGGVVGQITYSELDDKSLILLELGEILGVGKQVSFGMGKIEIR